MFPSPSMLLARPSVSRYALRRAALLSLLLIALLGASAALAGDLDQDFRFDARELTVDNVIGEVTIRGGSGDEFVVTAHVRGGDAESGLIRFDEQDGHKSKLRVVFPLDEETNYVYPPLGRLSNVSFNVRDKDGDEGGSWLKKVFRSFGGERIHVRGHGSGLELWVDLEVEVPAGRSLTLRNGVGAARATNVAGDLVIDTSSGAVEATSIEGDLLVDTGSGSVTVDDVAGKVTVDTGSGSVDASNIRGDLLVDTGSGSVKATGVRGDLNIDTGSGGVVARRIEADSALIDTGSGSVVLELDRMGRGEFLVDTGSGSVELVLPNDASAKILADTGSGGVHNRVKGAEVSHQERDELSMTIGAGEAKVKLDAGSGSVEIRQQ